VCFSFNRILRTSCIANLKEIETLSSIDFDGNPFLSEDGSLFFIVFTLPQVTIINRQHVQRDQRIQATERYSRSKPIHPVPLPVEVDATVFQHYTEETQNRRAQTLKQLQQKDTENQELRHTLNEIKVRDAISNLPSKVSESTEDSEYKIRKLKRKLLEAKSFRKRIEEDLEIERTVNLKQKQMISHLKQRYQNERRSKEPRENLKPKTSPTPSPINRRAEIRADILREENRKLQGRIEVLESEAQMHVREIEQHRAYSAGQTLSSSGQVGVFSSEKKGIEDNDFAEKDRLCQIISLC
jgi:hypothetical protein